MAKPDESGGNDSFGAGQVDAAKRPSGTSQIDFDLGFYDSILQREPNYIDVLRCQAELLSRKGLHARAVEADRRLVKLCPDSSLVRYNFACSLAGSGKPHDAIAQLSKAVELGYDDLEHLLADPDLDSLRDLPEYHALLRGFDLVEAGESH